MAGGKRGLWGGGGGKGKKMKNTTMCKKCCILITRCTSGHCVCTSVLGSN